MAIAAIGAAFFFLTGNSSSQSSASQSTGSGQAEQLAVDDIAPGEGGATGGNSNGHIVMTVCGSHDTYVRLGEEYVEGGCYARDEFEGPLSDKVQTSGNVDTSTVGDYTVTYSVQNSEGMYETSSRTVHVRDDLEWASGGIPILMYHYVYDPASPPADTDPNYISTTALEEQLVWLTSENYYYPSWPEMRAYVEGGHSLPAKSVMLTFDDGESGFLNLGVPLLEKYQVSATSFVICAGESTFVVLNAYRSPYVMYESHSFGLHTGGSSGIGRNGHIYDLNEDELVSDFQAAYDVLGTKAAFAYPFGDVSDAAPAALDRFGVLCAVTTEYDVVHPGADRFRLPRIRVFGEYPLDSFKSQVTMTE